MNFVLGAALMVAAIAFLHVGRRAVDRVAVVAPQRESLVTDLMAVAFTCMFGPGLVMFCVELMNGFDAMQLVLLGLSVAGFVAGVKLVGATARRAAAQIAPVVAPEMARQ